MTKTEEKEIREEVIDILSLVQKYIEKGIELSKIISVLQDLDKNHKDFSEKEIPEKEFSEKETRFIISDCLTKLGMPASLKGYAYTRDAIIYLIDNCNEDIAITKDVYPYVAKKLNTSASRVERAIRHSIDQTTPNMIQRIIGIFERKPLISKEI